MKNTRFRDFSRVGRRKKRRRRRRRFLEVGKKPTPRSELVDPGERVGGGKSGNGGSKARNDSRLWRVGSGSEDISSSPFHPKRLDRAIDDESGGGHRVARGGRRRMGGRKLLFHLRLRQLGKTAALPCLLPNYEREREIERE